jgi:hypothetical protein
MIRSDAPNAIDELHKVDGTEISPLCECWMQQARGIRSPGVRPDLARTVSQPRSGRSKIQPILNPVFEFGSLKDAVVWAAFQSRSSEEWTESQTKAPRGWRAGTRTEPEDDRSAETMLVTEVAAGEE